MGHGPDQPRSSVVHPVAARGFGDSPERYDRGRPGYPPEAVEWLVTHLQAGPGRVVADLGAGTGKLTVHLAAAGARVVAVEPLAGMRRPLVVNCPGVSVVGAVAEQLPIGTATLDALTAAQSYHWFDASRALAEFHRVLRRRGRLGLIWNVRDRSVEWVDRLGQILDRVERNAPWRDHDRRPRSGLEQTLGFGETHQAQFRHLHTVDRAGLIDRFLSVSHLAVRPVAEQNRILAEVLEVIERHPDTRGREVLDFPYRVDAYWLEKA
jgi:SAM-dependent methyltransferase